MHRPVLRVEAWSERDETERAAAARDELKRHTETDGIFQFQSSVISKK